MVVTKTDCVNMVQTLIISRLIISQNCRYHYNHDKYGILLEGNPLGLRGEQSHEEIQVVEHNILFPNVP